MCTCTNWGCDNFFRSPGVYSLSHLFFYFKTWMTSGGIWGPNKRSGNGDPQTCGAGQSWGRVTPATPLKIYGAQWHRHRDYFLSGVLRLLPCDKNKHTPKRTLFPKYTLKSTDRVRALHALSWYTELPRQLP